LEKGDIISDASVPGAPLRSVKMRHVFQETYLGAIRKCMECYGWIGETALDSKAVEEYSGAYRDWMNQGCPELDQPREGTSHPLFQKPLEALSWLLELINKWSNTRSGLAHQPITPEVAKAAAYIAAESTYSAICTRFAQNRHFRTGQFDTIAENAMHIFQSVFSDSLIAALRSSDSTIKLRNAIHTMNKITVSQFRAQAMASLLPGALINVSNSGTSDAGVSGRDLAYASNGYVALAPSLRSITSKKSDIMAIEVVSGYIRWDNDDISLQRLKDSEPRGDEGIETTTTNTTLYPYGNTGQYTGVDLRSDPEEATIRYHLAVEKKILWVTTSIVHPDNNRVQVDWISAIEAMVMANHVVNSTLPAFIEETMTDNWKRDNLWRTIKWTTASGKITHRQGTPIRYIGQTYNDEELRFFLAGRRTMQKLFVRHGSTSLAKCIQEALEYEQSSGEALRTVSETRPPWISPDMEEQMRFPGWLISS
jgi:hypothetical protein